MKRIRTGSPRTGAGVLGRKTFRLTPGTPMSSGPRRWLVPG
jgi:hypothetical protein